MPNKTILILHGWPQYKLENYFLTKELVDKDYQVICPNLFDENIEFNLQNILKKTLHLLKGEAPYAIVGISMGGLILPHLTKEFPKSKLIFVASGANIKSESKIFNLLLQITNIRLFKIILDLIYKLPNIYFEKLYCRLCKKY